MAVLPTASESPLVYACEPWVFAMCPALRGSTVSYAGDAHFAKHSLEYSLNFWSQPKKKKLNRIHFSLLLTKAKINMKAGSHILAASPERTSAVQGAVAVSFGCASRNEDTVVSFAQNMSHGHFF